MLQFFPLMHLGHCERGAIDQEHRVISKTIPSARLSQNGSADFAAKTTEQLTIHSRGQHTNECGLAMAVVNARQFRQQLTVVVFV